MNLKRFTKYSIKLLKRLNDKYENITIIKMLKQIVSQLERMCLKLALKKMATLWLFQISSGSLFHRTDSERAKARSPKVDYLLKRF